jgi:hypothetical protein
MRKWPVWPIIWRGEEAHGSPRAIWVERALESGQFGCGSDALFLGEVQSFLDNFPARFGIARGLRSMFLNRHPSPRLPSGRRWANGTSVYWRPSLISRPASLPQLPMARRQRARRITQRAFLEPLSGNRRTSLPSPETEIGIKRAETGARNPRP